MVIIVWETCITLDIDRRHIVLEFTTERKCRKMFVGTNKDTYTPAAVRRNLHTVCIINHRPCHVEDIISSILTIINKSVNNLTDIGVISPRNVVYEDSLNKFKNI